MTGLAKQRRIRLILAASGLLALAAVLIGHGWRDGVQFFRTPSQVLSDPPRPQETFRIGGILDPGSVRREGSLVRFRISDGETSIVVAFEGITPDLFREGEGVIAAGRLVDGTVHAHEVLARHDETYVPRELAGMGLD